MNFGRNYLKKNKEKIVINEEILIEGVIKLLLIDLRRIVKI